MLRKGDCDGRYSADCDPVYSRQARHWFEKAARRGYAPAQVNLAVIYIGRRGGYIDQPITDQDYAFHFALPPRPHPAAEPRAVITRMTATLPVQTPPAKLPVTDGLIGTP